MACGKTTAAADILRSCKACNALVTGRNPILRRPPSACLSRTRKTMQKIHNLMRTGARPWFCGLLLGLAVWWPPVLAEVVRVAAASNLKFVLADIESQYRKQTGLQTEFIFGSSVQLARQIRQGLPVQLFISADEDQVAWLHQAGLTRDAGQRYAMGRLALISPKRNGISLGQGLAAALQALQPADKLAIANPQLAPYGLAAQEVLQKTASWPALKNRLVLGENVGQATQFVLGGAAPLGLTAYSLTLAPEVADRLQVWPVPAGMHAPLPQRLVLLKGASAQAEALRDHLLGPATRTLWQKHGYALPQ